MGSHKLVELVFYVSLLVIIVLAATFIMLFSLYATYKRKNIKNGHEDLEILSELKKKYKIDELKKQRESSLESSSDVSCVLNDESNSLTDSIDLENNESSLEEVSDDSLKVEDTTSEETEEVSDDTKEELSNDLKEEILENDNKEVEEIEEEIEKELDESNTDLEKIDELEELECEIQEEEDEVETSADTSYDTQNKTNQVELKPIKLVDLMKKQEKKNFAFNIVGKVVSKILFVLLAILVVISLAYKANGNQFFFGNTTYLVIQTSSMESVNDTNTYIKENKLDNQIIQYSMVGIEKVDEKDINVYDILAFTNTDGDIIVHRVIRINSTNGVTTYTLRGDANNASNSYELSVNYSQVVGRYNGYNSYGLGVATTYFKSTAGIVALVSALVFLVLFDISESLIDDDYETRKLIVAKKYDEEEEENEEK